MSALASVQPKIGTTHEVYPHDGLFAIAFKEVLFGFTRRVLTTQVLIRDYLPEGENRAEVLYICEELGMVLQHIYDESHLTMSDEEQIRVVKASIRQTLRAGLSQHLQNTRRRFKDRK